MVPEDLARRFDNMFDMLKALGWNEEKSGNNVIGVKKGGTSIPTDELMRGKGTGGGAHTTQEFIRKMMKENWITQSEIDTFGKTTNLNSDEMLTTHLKKYNGPGEIGESLSPVGKPLTLEDIDKFTKSLESRSIEWSTWGVENHTDYNTDYRTKYSIELLMRDEPFTIVSVSKFLEILNAKPNHLSESEFSTLKQRWKEDYHTEFDQDVFTDFVKNITDKIEALIDNHDEKVPIRSIVMDPQQYYYMMTRTKQKFKIEKNADTLHYNDIRVVCSSYSSSPKGKYESNFIYLVGSPFNNALLDRKFTDTENEDV